MSWFFLIVLFSLSSCTENKEITQRKLSSVDLPEYSGVQEIFNKRCIVCHACYNAPCQLKLTSYEGFMRGANKEIIYSQSLKTKELSRLFVDAHTPGEWRKKGFFSVIKHDQLDDPEAIDEDFDLLHAEVDPEDDHFFMKFLKTKYKTQNNEPSLDAIDKNTCPETRIETTEYFQLNKNGGMPLGFPSLEKNEIDLIESWILNGSKAPEKPVLLRDEIIRVWEQRLNGKATKDQITNRYLFEKLFMAHIQFPHLKGRNFRFVRSRGDLLAPLDEIATQRAYDDPGKNFSYRFKEITSTIVYKTHIVFKMNEKFYKRLEHLFYKKKWENKNPKLPAYENKDSSNPFITFKDIPEKSRYQFMLDNAAFIVRNFIRGPVCFGQIALNAIRDHFWVVFADPQSDMSIKYLKNGITSSGLRNLDIPAKDKNSANPIIYNSKAGVYNKQFGKYFAKKENNSLGIEYLWKGDETNPNALLTVNRHFDSATVRQGHLGEFPKTVWLIDYSSFERIWYNLVAGFSPYGNVLHQIATRIYMGGSRIESEDHFLTLYPKEERLKTRGVWYHSKKSQALLKIARKGYSLGGVQSNIEFKTKNYLKEIIENFWDGLSEEVRGPLDQINRVNSSTVGSVAPDKLELQKISAIRGKFVSFFSENTFLKVEGSGAEYKIFTILRNNDRKYVNTLFLESGGRDHSHDTLNVYPGYVGAYPNYFMVIKKGELARFIGEVRKLKTKTNYLALQKKYGIDRYNPHFWNYFDFFQKDFLLTAGDRGGVFDLSRYQLEMGKYHLDRENRLKRFLKSKKYKIKNIFDGG